MKSRTIVNTSILVTSITILAILPGWFSALLFKTPFNSPIYYGVVIVLSIVSIVFGTLQWTPELLEARHSRGAWQTHITSTESETEHQMFYDSLASTLTELLPSQRKVILDTLLERINLDIRSKQQNYPVKVTMEIKGSPVMIEMPDVEKVEDIIKRVAQGIQASPNSTDVKPSIIRENEGTYQVDDISAQK